MKWYGVHTLEKCRQTGKSSKRRRKRRTYSKRYEQEDRPHKMGHRRKRGDVLFNYITGKVKLEIDDFIILNKRKTRGPSKKLKAKGGHKYVKKFSFQNGTSET